MARSKESSAVGSWLNASLKNVGWISGEPINAGLCELNQQDIKKCGRLDQQEDKEMI